jgi:hypothetical protein
MKKSQTIFTLLLIGLLLIPLAGFSQAGRDTGQTRMHRHPSWILSHYSAIGPDGTFYKIIRETAGTTSANAATAENAAATWKIEIVPLNSNGTATYMTLPGYPSHFAVGENNLLYVAIPDIAAWKTPASGQSAEMKTRLYLIPATSLLPELTENPVNPIIMVDLDGFASSLRVRSINSAVYAYLTVRDVTTNGALTTAETEYDRRVVVIDSTGKKVNDVELK